MPLLPNPSTRLVTGGGGWCSAKDVLSARVYGAKGVLSARVYGAKGVLSARGCMVLKVY